jgi:hypothetical protein
MGWELILIVLVPLGVWILSNVFRGDDDRAGNKPQNARPAAASRRPVSDLDRFLEEARRRREAGERRPPPEASPPPRPEPRPVPPRETRPARSTASASRRPVQTASTRPNRPPVLLEPVPDASSSMPSPARLEMVGMEPARVDSSLPQTHLPMAVALVAAPAAPRISADRANTSPTLTRLTELLRGPEAAGMAFALRAVFDPPLSRRQRR